jgi:antitoxin VapB
MTLSIKDNEADALARELAERTGESLTEAVKRALRERLDRESGQTAAHGLSQRLLAIGRRCAAEIPGPCHSSDHADLLYDEGGLPR